MEAKLFTQSRISFTTGNRRRCIRRDEYSPVLAVLTRPSENTSQITDKSSVKQANDSAGKTSVYNDNWFDKMAINHLSKSIQAVTGIRNNKTGFESLVAAATATYRNFNPIQQHELVIQALGLAFPKPIMTMIRTMLPKAQFTREFFAAFTTVFFAWLVGPCEVRESELNGEKEKNEVYIKKCRFLEESNCVGMCTNLCKMPSQTFIKDNLGVSLNMVPNFDDMSCKMIFGQDPPSLADDPAFTQPCYKQCKVKQKHRTQCPG
ncbi:beta-carotene isomerase D27, chloroplastic [Tripterygium wilfordii]|uniref:beta-carotene isomerase D27, chloroplastic n=1 Tax=Tripterygium wilfordii TaxID=458696 RepID=UPI0018F7FE4D|nr:beta-carotene isomerase D27, chloroplastic [Tripterygium wilfordii]